MSDDAAPALFEVGAAETGPARPGRVEAALRRALKAGFADGTIRDVDEALGEAALVGARILDAADRVGGLKGGYLGAQALPPFQRLCHALRLPAELTPASPPPPAPAGEGAGDWLKQLGATFGTPES